MKSNVIFYEINIRRTGKDGISGYGFELTFRLKRETDETTPPTWPANLMQTLGRYVFQTRKYTSENY